MLVKLLLKAYARYLIVVTKSEYLSAFGKKISTYEAAIMAREAGEKLPFEGDSKFIAFTEAVHDELDLIIAKVAPPINEE